MMSSPRERCFASTLSQGGRIFFEREAKADGKEAEKVKTVDKLTTGLASAPRPRPS